MCVKSRVLLKKNGNKFITILSTQGFKFGKLVRSETKQNKKSQKERKGKKSICTLQTQMIINYRGNGNLYYTS